ncbi:MAG: type IX secretion system outer membrane channel protein PorV [Bacteroidales bacterium]|nr:type IX secretion system outer membrane channel protein PorV [Bacteroidales bacterium]
MKKKTSLLVLIVLLVSSQIQAQSMSQLSGKELNTITTAVPFLQIAPDSRGGAMGDVGCATSADINSQAYNPAKYVFNKNTFGISVSYSPWLRNLVSDINLLYLSTYWRMTEMDAIAFSLRYFSLGDIQFTDDMGNPTMEENPNEFALDFTYSRKLIDELSIALTPRFIYSNLTAGQYVGGQETRAGLAGAADLSLFYEQELKAKKLESSILRAGFCISNMGNKMSYSSGTLRRDFLPTNLKIGLGYEMGFDEYNKLAITGEVNKLLVPTNPVYQTDSITGRIIYDQYNNPVILSGRDPDVSVPQGMIQSFYDAPGIGHNGVNASVFAEEMAEIIWALGAEYSYRDLFFVRLGYFHESKYKGNRQFLSMGVGLKYNVFNIDVSYLFTTNGQTHPLANTLRFTLSFDFSSFNKEDIKKQGRLKKY